MKIAGPKPGTLPLVPPTADALKSQKSGDVPAPSFGEVLKSKLDSAEAVQQSTAAAPASGQAVQHDIVRKLRAGEITPRQAVQALADAAAAKHADRLGAAAEQLQSILRRLADEDPLIAEHMRRLEHNGAAAK